MPPPAPLRGSVLSATPRATSGGRLTGHNSNSSDVASASRSFAVHRLPTPDEETPVWRLSMPRCCSLWFAELVATLDCEESLYSVGTSTLLPVPFIPVLPAATFITHAPAPVPTLGQAMGRLDAEEHRLTFARLDEERAVLWTRDPDVLTAALHIYVEELIEELAAGTPLPSLAIEHIAPLAEPVPEDSWTEVSLGELGESLTCTLTTHSPTGSTNLLRWVGRSGGAWRPDWSW